MSMAEEHQGAVIPWEAAASLESMKRTLAAAEQQHRGKIFIRLGGETLRLVPRDEAPAEFQRVVDELQSIGEAQGFVDGALQTFMQAATMLPPDRRPGQAAAPPPRLVTDQDEPPPFEFIPESAEADIYEPVARAPLAFATPADWPEEAPPPIDWLADSRIPRGDVTTLHGDGGAGKTDIALQLAEGCSRGAGYWLGHEIAQGPVVIISAEEPERELRRRVWLHGQRDGFAPRDLEHLHFWFPSEAASTVFAVPDRNGVMQQTPLFDSVAAAIADVAPVLVIVDNVAATFTGNQNDRVMVRSYVNLWRTIAHGPSLPAVVLLDHPSLSGMTAGTGRGGNMDWRNAVRSALYLKASEDKAEAERGVRILETAKSNYGPTGQPLRLQWGEGGLELEHAPSSLHRIAKDTECEEIFLRLVDERNAQGRHVSDKNGKNYAPAILADMSGAGGFTAKAFAGAMNRLFEARKIALRTIRQDGKPRAIIDRIDANAPPTLRAEAAE
jgi:RecA-family ATPase